MRPAIRPGGTMRTLSELQANYPKVAVAYTQVATIATDDHHTLQQFRASVGAQWTFLSDPDRTVQQGLDIAEYTNPEHTLMAVPPELLSEITRGGVERRPAHRGDDDERLRAVISTARDDEQEVVVP